MNLSNFAERIKELIFEADLTVTKLSEILDCGNATISHYATGRYFPTVEMTVKLADFFNCSTDFLLGLVNENYKTNFKPCPPFSEQLLNLCSHFNITRYKLHKLTGISESVIRYWAQGKTTPTIYNVEKIASKLNCTVDFVLGRE